MAYYFAQSIVTPTLVESGIGEALIETIGATRALNRLLCVYNHNSDSCNDHELAEGIERLVETQCLVLAGIHNAVEADESAREADALAATEAEAGKAAGGKVKDVRRQFILAQAAAGVDAATIASAVSMKIGFVAEVLASARAVGEA